MLTESRKVHERCLRESLARAIRQRNLAALKINELTRRRVHYLETLTNGRNGQP